VNATPDRPEDIPGGTVLIRPGGDGLREARTRHRLLVHGDLMRWPVDPASGALTDTGRALLPALDAVPARDAVVEAITSHGVLYRPNRAAGRGWRVADGSAVEALGKAAGAHPEVTRHPRLDVGHPPRASGEPGKGTDL
jgi:hypothetical protein